MRTEDRSRLLDWARRLRGGAGGAEDSESDPPAAAWGAEVGMAADRMLWRRLEADETVSADAIAAVPGLRLEGEGPLLERGEEDAVEVWVDRELAAMHALHRAGRLLELPAWAARLRDACDWHVEHTGTENATHRPWAVHVFLLHGSPDAEFFAAGQLHAVAVEHGLGRPDPCTAWILQDAARELDLAAAAAGGALP